jgi:hypothetical protein
MMLDNTRLSRDCRTILAIAWGVATLVLAGVSSSAPGFAQNASTDAYKYNDSHFHLTNYIQEGTKVGDYVKMMDGVVKTLYAFWNSFAADVGIRKHRRVCTDLLSAD